MTDADKLDPAALERLHEWGGDKLVGQMVQLFLDNSPARMDQIRNGIDGADASQAEQGAHSLKSSAANVGAERLRVLSADVEGAALSKDLTAVEGLLSDLEAAYANAVSQLEEVAKGTGE